MPCAVITGSSRGIGRTIAIALAKAGYTVAVHGHTESDELQDTLRTVQELQPSSAAFFGDISTKEAADALARNIRSSYSAIDVLVNNAGIAQDATVERMSVEQWDAVLRTNLDGTFYMTQNLLPSLCEGGRIVMMASVAGLHGVYGKANYCASKAGLLGLTRSLALEVASRSITVNAVCPGVIDTDMVSAIPEKYRAKLIENTPLHRLGNPEEVASLVQFLVSKEAGYITGQAITIDGGLTVSL